MVYPHVNDPVSVPAGTPNGTLFVDVGDTFGVGLKDPNGNNVSLKDCARGYWTDRNLSAAHADQCEWLAARNNGAVLGIWKIDKEKGWMSAPPAVIPSRPFSSFSEPRSICNLLPDDLQDEQKIRGSVHLGRSPNT